MIQDVSSKTSLNPLLNRPHIESLESPFGGGTLWEPLIMMDRDKARSSQLIGQSTKCFQCGKITCFTSGHSFNKFILLNIRRFPELQLEKRGFACKLSSKRLHTRRGKFQHQNERLIPPKSPTGRLRQPHWNLGGPHQLYTPAHLVTK